MVGTVGRAGSASAIVMWGGTGRNTSRPSTTSTRIHISRRAITSDWKRGICGQRPARASSPFGPTIRSMFGEAMYCV